jgi:hypothetical protein
LSPFVHPSFQGEVSKGISQVNGIGSKVPPQPGSITILQKPENLNDVMKLVPGLHQKQIRR